MDVRDPEGGLYQVTRLSGPDEQDGVWVARPDPGGDATVAGHRGAIGFVLEVTLGQTRPRHRTTSPKSPI